MSSKQQIWTVTLVMTIAVLAWQYYPRARDPAAAPESPVQNLFDSQAVPSALPVERPRSAQDEPPSAAKMPGVTARSRRGSERSVRLGVDQAPRDEDVFASGRGNYRWLGNIFALPKDRAGSLEVVEARPGYVFVKVPEGGAPAGAFPVAFEPKNGMLYVVTGRLTVHFQSVADAASLSQDYAIELLRLMARLNTATYQSTRPSVQKLTELLVTLRKDERVVKADLEMIGEGRTAQ